MGRASKRKKLRFRDESAARRRARLVALHEAGHVVVGLAMREEVAYAWIREGEGYTQPLSPRWFRDLCEHWPKNLVLRHEQKQYILGRVMSTLAGPIAERAEARLAGVELPSDAAHPEGDYRQAFTLAVAVRCV